MSNPTPVTNDEHWVRTLYERYVQLYGDPIEQPSKTKKEEPQDHEHDHFAS